MFDATLPRDRVHVELGIEMVGDINIKLVGGYGSAGAGNRTGRRIASQVGIGQTAKERNNRIERLSLPAKGEWPELNEFESWVQTGRCWWCESNKVFTNLSSHWAKAHGIYVRDVRNYYGFIKKRSFISSELSATFSQQARKHYNAEKLQYHGGKREITTALVNSNRAKLDAFWDSLEERDILEQRSAAGKSLKGKPKSESHRKSLSNSIKSAYDTGRRRLLGSDNPMHGKKWTPEFKIKMMNARLKAAIKRGEKRLVELKAQLQQSNENSSHKS